MHFDLIELLKQARLVAYPLGLCSILAVAIVLERIFMLWWIRKREDEAFEIMQASLEKGAEYRPGNPAIAGAPVAQIMDTLVSLRGATEEAIWNASEIALSLQRVRLRRFMSILATIASISPFIGLFGTVLGVMHSFASLGANGGQNAEVSNSIAEALAATALGLLVAIPSVIAYNSLLGHIQSSLLHVQGHVSRLIPLMRSNPARARQPQEV